MITENMVKPSFWVETGVKISKVRQLYLFKFTDQLQERLDELSEKNKTETLTLEETAELAGILELNQIFTLMNAKIIAESK
ncbi:hypothetical protein [Crocosphaera sp. XPORK-15E]|uniref:hypothetical protein n=1 Tax=Crocosphaera sp. XPORK-15E TaxID=3110247 RepID=UPI002B210EFB|nr:hypothetical protein [Crocosphaera sp. XPORK-15E]MEA5533049.1 hypothetical protein [Crocosphaera sp. XPORK-15E]